MIRFTIGIWVLLAVACIALASCASKPVQPAVEIRTITVTKETQRPCPVKIPDRPAPLGRPLPVDPVALSALLGAKLIEWAGAGGYGDKATGALLTCTKPIG